MTAVRERSPRNLPRALAVLAAALVVAACGSRGGYYGGDGPPRRHDVDLSRVADAVPKHEPRSRTGNRPYTALGQSYRPLSSARGYRERGVASWYGRKFHGRRTSSGETYDMYAMTAAHRTLPLPTYARVRNLRNGRSVVVKINDRGPFLHNRLIDLSYAAAYRLGISASGTGLVEVTAVFPGDGPAPLPVPVQARVVAAPQLYVQFGAFAQRGNAEVLRGRLRQDAFTPTRVTAAADRLFRVRVGPLDSVEQADLLITRAQQQGYEPTLIIE